MPDIVVYILTPIYIIVVLCSALDALADLFGPG